MVNRIAPVGATLSILGLLAWLLISKPAEPKAAEASPNPTLDPVQQERAGGSTVPCVVPLGWRIEAVDERFGLSSDDAEAAVRGAAALWEEAVGRGLFAEDPAAGLPVRLVYDDRQANLLKRLDLQSEFDAAGAKLDERQADLTSQQASFNGVRDAYQQRVDAFETRVREHNAVVDRWNKEGGAPEDTVRQLEAEGTRLQAERRELDVQQQTLEGSRASLQAVADRLNQDLVDHGNKGVALERMFPQARVEAGLYRESVHEQAGRVVSIQREIDIYRFASPSDLRLVAAHELGHALGLGHSSSTGALMSEERHGTPGVAKGSAILPSDLELLASRCPELTALPRP